METNLDAVPAGVGDELFDVDQAAGYLKVTSRMIRRLIAERRVPFYRVGRHVRLRRSDLDQLLQSGRVEAQR